MICRKCRAEVADGPFCSQCGTRQTPDKKPGRRRGNGQGSVYKLPNGKYKAVQIVAYYREEGKLRKVTRSQVFAKKSDAVAALPSLKLRAARKKKEHTTFKELYDRWLPTHKAGKSTMDCYKAAMKHFRPVWHLQMADIDIDDLQDCLDNCGAGKRTQQNMKTVCGLVYKFGIPRNCTPNNLNLADFLTVSGEGAAHRDSFTDDQISAIRQNVGRVPYADYVYCMIYLGFRPSEFLALDASSYDEDKQCFIGGAKTDAGIDRIVTISPKILPVIKTILSGRKQGAFFHNSSGAHFSLRDWTENCFYPALENCGIDNPMVEIAGGVMRHKYTPHSCRHTFATLMKRVDGPSKDKQELIGHSSEEQLKYYQDVEIADLKRITDKI